MACGDGWLRPCRIPVDTRNANRYPGFVMTKNMKPRRERDPDAEGQITEKQLQALYLVDCGTGMQLTHYANTLVSRQAKWLLAEGLIAYAPERWIAYQPTDAGKRVIAAERAKEHASNAAQGLHCEVWCRDCGGIRRGEDRS